MNVTVSVVLETRTPKKKRDPGDPDVYPIKLRLTQNKTQRYFRLPKSKTAGIVFEATEDEWSRINSTGARGKLRDIKLQIPKVIEEAENVIKGLEEFSFREFRDAFYKEKRRSKTLFDFFQEYIHTLYKEDRVATAQSYQCALNSFKTYDPHMNFAKVDKAYLDAYERWFLSMPKGQKRQGGQKSQTTAGIYTRSLRTIFNIAKKAGATTRYPFGRDGYTPPSGANVKKGLEMDDIKKIVDYSPKHKSPEDQARDLFVFSYFSGGMNIKDICSIRVKDIKGDLQTIEFVREKTKLSRRGSQRKSEVLVVPETKAIIEKWGKPEGDPEDYVFPFFKKDFTPLNKRATIMQLVKTTNKYLRKMAQELDLPMDITTYHARHSYASILKESGASIEYISETLGHTNTQTTEAYLKSFSRAHREKWADALRGNRKEE